jgi:hypothetical protein
MAQHLSRLRLVHAVVGTVLTIVLVSTAVFAAARYLAS